MRQTNARNDYPDENPVKGFIRLTQSAEDQSDVYLQAEAVYTCTRVHVAA